MATDPSHHPDTRDNDDADQPGREPTGIPRWVWLVGLVVLIVALLVVAVVLLGGENGHGGGPSRH